MKTRRQYYGRDRISGLPDSLLLQILSNLKVEQAVQISIVSTRWKDMWKHVSVLYLCDDYRYFKSIESFSNFVSQIFSFRNDKTSLQALTFRGRYRFDPELLKRILQYLFSHNIQQLNMMVACSLEHFPLSTNFSCHTLTSLKLFSRPEWGKYDRLPPVFPNSLQFPALNYLFLGWFTFCCTTDDYADPFSVFQSLKTLTIQFCELLNEKTLFISSVSLFNLRILLPTASYKLKLSTPNLCSFAFRGHSLQNLCGHNCISNTNFSYIKHVRIELARHQPQVSPSILFNWLVELGLMESLTISSKTLEVLSLVPDSWKIDFSYLHNLKLLKIETHDICPSPPDGTEDFLLQNAKSAKKVILPGPTLEEICKSMSSEQERMQ
ncbi:unnamed protein product [Lathyrus sativus]|nr:unnamed protein product [Lathyrus sativus]